MTTSEPYACTCPPSGLPISEFTHEEGCPQHPEIVAVREKGLSALGDSPKPEYNYVRKTDEEIKQLAMDYLAGKIFGNWMIPRHEMQQVTGMIFMPMLLGGPEMIAQLMVNDTPFFYEYLEKAGPRSVNGYPIFFSMQTIDLADLNRVMEKGRALKAAMDAV